MILKAYICNELDDDADIRLVYSLMRLRANVCVVVKLSGKGWQLSSKWSFCRGGELQCLFKQSMRWHYFVVSIAPQREALRVFRIFSIKAVAPFLLCILHLEYRYVIYSNPSNLAIKNQASSIYAPRAYRLNQRRSWPFKLLCTAHKFESLRAFEAAFIR